MYTETRTNYILQNWAFIFENDRAREANGSKRPKLA